MAGVSRVCDDDDDDDDNDDDSGRNDDAAAAAAAGRWSRRRSKWNNNFSTWSAPRYVYCLIKSEGGYVGFFCRKGLNSCISVVMLETKVCNSSMRCRMD